MVVTNTIQAAKARRSQSRWMIGVGEYCV
jgi:hypothetical protein